MLKPVTATALVAVVCATAVAVLGAYFAAGMVTDGRRAPALQHGSSVALDLPAAIGQDIPRSFGVAAVEGITKMAGPTATVHYSPARFTLHATRGSRFSTSARTSHLVRSSVAPGTLQPDASIEATLDFVAPRDGSKLWIRFNDPARAPPLVFDLGRTDRTRGPR